jgi:molybdate/tungstate transport system ATP-binding protein
MIEVHVSKRVRAFSLEAEISGDGFICIAGRNGSGKTTLLRSIAGLTGCDGYVKVDGGDVSALPPERRNIVMVTPTSPMLHLDVDSHIGWGAKRAGITVPGDRINEIKSSLGIDFGGQTRRLSLGMKERVSLATALLSGRRVILVDEAFANLHDKETFMGMYRELAKKVGADVVFSSLDKSDGRLADHLFLIEEGRTREASLP